MKIYAVADIHGAQNRMNTIQNNITTHQPDLVVICGDLTQFGPGEQARSFLDSLPVKTIAVPGNIDTADVYKAIEESSALSLHEHQLMVDTASFVGFGGEMDIALSEILIASQDGKKKFWDAVDESSIVVTHVPPHGLQDKVFMGKHIGNKEFRSLIDEKQPRLVLCGHVHEDPGYTHHNSTVVVNCSMGKRTEGAMITLNEQISVNILV